MTNNKIICFLLLAIILFTMLPVSAERASFSEMDIRSVENAIISVITYKSNGTGLQEWLDGTLTDEAGSSSEWYVIALRQYDGSLNYNKYADALEEYLSESDIPSAATRQKYALALIACGRPDHPFVLSTLEDSIGQQGIMSWIYGLHLLNNGAISDKYTSAEVVDKLLSLQLDDGGWALQGETSDVDVTAMAIQSLAPYYNNSKVGAAVDEAVSVLASKQLENGSYQSYGKVNPESVCQVMLALVSVGIDFTHDERFVKNNINLLEVILQYQLEKGGFCHEIGGAVNETATIQAFYSLVSLWREQSGLGLLYIFDKAELESESHTETTEIGTESPNSTFITESETPEELHETNDPVTSTNSGISYKIWAYLIIFIILVIICVILFICGKRHVKNYIFAILVAIAAICIVTFTNIETTDSYYSGNLPEKINITGTVTLTIRCDTIIGKSDSEFIPEDGIILPVTEFSIEDGNTVFDILTEAAKKYGIQLENVGSVLDGDLVYILGINYLYEFDFGDLSGWEYHVNGTAPSVGCGEYVLSDGDKIEWLYTCNLGDDLK